MGRVEDAFSVETELREQLRGRLAPDARIYLADEYYWLTPLHDVINLLVRERLDKLVYRPRVRDCDDYALVLHARMVESQRGNQKRNEPHCFGQVWGMVGATYGHAINIMINSDGAVRFVEPQNSPSKAVFVVDDCPLTSIWWIRI